MKTTRLSLAILALGLFLLDRVAKQIIIHLPTSAGGEVFYFTPYINYGGAFGLYLPPVILIPIAISALVWLVYLWHQFWQQKLLNRFFGVSLMIAGGFSNFLDRILVGGVVDFWWLALGRGLNFNLADVYLLVGALIMLMSYYQPRPNLS